jgi:hypothetical protein
MNVSHYFAMLTLETLLAFTITGTFTHRGD